jgi:hypothetical protein
MRDSPAAPAPMSRRELEEKIIARAWTDDEFRQKFVADPKGQFEAHLGTKLPEALQMTAHEETEHSLHFVIPMKPEADLSELSDEDLEKVAGGVDVIVGTAVAITIAVSLGTGAAVYSAVTVGQKLGGWGKG